MKANINQITDNTKNEIRKYLEGKSIFEMTVWVRDRAQYLKWFCNYNEAMLDARVQAIMSFSHFLNTNYRDDQNVIDDFRELCVACAIDLETNCR
jgi:hypothetical protein